MKRLLLILCGIVLMACLPMWADVYTFSTGNVTNAMAVASRPDAGGNFEIEAADDFVTTGQTHITSATFTGLLTGGATIADVGEVVVEIYRVFPLDSNTVRTPNVPTRANSPSDVAFDSKTSPGGLTFGESVLSASFTASNSVAPGGIHPKPNQTTLGNGPITGQEVQFTVNFTTPFDLPADHYFFVPQVEVTSTNGVFYWLSGTRPIVAPGTPFLPDLQMWTRDANLDPDWLRVGTDIVGGTTPPTFNGAFTLSGETVPEPASMVLMVSGVVGVLARRRKR